MGPSMRCKSRMSGCGLAIAALAGIACSGGAAFGNLISNSSFGAGGAGWQRNGLTQIGVWSSSDGSCAYNPRMSDGIGQVWQYVPSWKLPSVNTTMYYWDARKSWYGQDNRANIHIYGLKTSAAVTGNYVPGGTAGVDYDVVAGRPHLVMGNGFWWSSEYYKWNFSNVTRSRFPRGLLLRVDWGGGWAYGAGFDDFVLTTASAGTAAGNPVVGTSTGTTGQSVVSTTLPYSGIGITTPWWIDPEWAAGYEYELTQNAGRTAFKSIELVPVGDGLYDVDVWRDDTWVEIAADVESGEWLFSTLGETGPVYKFRVRGIEQSAGIPLDGHGFPLGVTFTNGGWDVSVTMTGFVPTPGAAMTMVVAGLLAVRRRR